MKSFRQLYISDPEDYRDWAASPGCAPDQFFTGSFPSTRIMAMGEDILNQEAMQFSDRLVKNGQRVWIKSYRGLPHQAFSMGKLFPELLNDFEDGLRRDFGARSRWTEWVASIWWQGARFCLKFAW